MSKVIVHIDLNAFFARAEEIKDPTLEGKPIAVGFDGRRGVISTCSYAARALGVRSGMPTFKAKQVCPQLIIKNCDFRYYQALSNTFMNFVKTYTKLVEIASVDECFADFTEVVKGMKDVEEFFREFQNALFKKTKLKCSIGVATTKFLAKMGSDLRKPMGLTIIRKRDIPTLLYPLPIEDTFGVGKKTAPRLMAIGINTIGDLAKRFELGDEELKQTLGKFYDTLNDWISGRGSDEISLEEWNPKSIGHSSTFYHDTNNFDEIKHMFEHLSRQVSEGAIREHKIGDTIQIVVKDSDFTVHNKSSKLRTPTNDFETIYSKAIKLYEDNFLGREVRLVGVTLQNLISPRDMAIQMNFYDYEDHEEDAKTKLLINDLNRKLSKPMLIRASEVQGKGKKNGNK